jgi:hypothetical protein
MVEPIQRNQAIRYDVSVKVLPEAGMPVRFEANEKERAALTRQLRISEVRSLTAEVRVKRWRGEGVKVTGELVAEVVQQCVVTLDPLDETVRETIAATFVPEGSKLARVASPRDDALHVDPEGEDIPDTFSGDRIDLGALFCETTALGLDPYPRKAGAAVVEDLVMPAAETQEERVSPFARLATLRPKNGEEG